MTCVVSSLGPIDDCHTVSIPCCYYILLVNTDCLSYSVSLIPRPDLIIDLGLGTRLLD